MFAVKIRFYFSSIAAIFTPVEKTATVERYHIFVFLMLSGGFMGAYSYFLKGGVFANAETANLLLLALHLAEMDWNAVLMTLVPILTFFLGSFVSEFFRSKISRSWPKLLLLFEVLLISLLSFLPESTPFPIFHSSIALISSMQYNTFQKARGVQLSTLFCTAHLRGGASSFFHAYIEKDARSLKRGLYHIGMIFTFVLGAFLCAVLSPYLETRTLIFSAIPLLLALKEIWMSES